MNLTLRQLLPQCKGMARVVQPFTYSVPEVTIFETTENMCRYFSDDELDRYINNVSVHDGFSTPTLMITLVELPDKPRVPHLSD